MWTFCEWTTTTSWRIKSPTSH